MQWERNTLRVMQNTYSVTYLQMQMQKLIHVPRFWHINKSLVIVSLYKIKSISIISDNP